MEASTISLILDGLLNSLTLYNILMMLIGLALGVFFGALPGLSATTGMALLLPITFGLPLEGSLLMLGAVYAGALYGGNISAILLGIPGTAAALPTTFDGFPMTRQGRSKEALLYGLYASAFGGLVSAFILLFLTPVIGKFALKFGAPEILALALWGLSTVSGVTGKNVLKGLIVAVIGLIVSSIGTSPVGGYNRFVFGVPHLLAGLGLVPLVLGTMALPRVFEVFDQMKKQDEYFLKSNVRKWFLKPVELIQYWVTFVKSAIIGAIIGIAPAAGPSIASIMSYNESKRSSKNPESYGKGNPEGVVASETANSASVGGDLVLTLSVGVPGSAACAVMLGALIMKGIQPGPLLLKNSPVSAYTFFMGFIIVNLLIFLVGHLYVQMGSYILKTPLGVLGPAISVICSIGAYTDTNDLFGVQVMIIAGVIAYLLIKLDFPIAPFLLAIILGPLIEANFWTAYYMTGGDLWSFFKRPVFDAILILSVLTFALPVLLQKRKRASG